MMKAIQEKKWNLFSSVFKLNQRKKLARLFLFELNTARPEASAKKLLWNFVQNSQE